MKKLHFDEDNHQYSLEMEGGLGSPLYLPSVSQVIRSAGMYDYPKNEAMTIRMAFGTRVHGLTTQFDQNLIDIRSLDHPEEALCLNDYKDFSDATGFEPEHIEQKMYHPMYMYAGTPDRIGALVDPNRKESVRAVIDIKTGRPHPTTQLQLAAYLMLAREAGYPAETAFALYIGKGWRLLELQDFTQSSRVFLSALSVHRWKELHKIG